MGITDAAPKAISTTKPAEDEEVVRVYMEYQSLYLTDLHRIFRPLARAYSHLNVTVPVRERFPSHGRRTYKAILDSAYMARSRGRGYEAASGHRLMARYQPLRVETLETGHSIILLCKGAAALIIEMAEVAKTVFQAVEKYWKMKDARDTRKISSPGTQRRSSRGREQAAKELKELASYVEKTTRITEFHLQLNGLTWTHMKSTTRSR